VERSIWERERIENELRKEIENKDAELEKNDEQLYRIIRKMSKEGFDSQLIGEITGLSNEKTGRILRNHRSR
jgi:hypothetical protein